MLIPLISKSKLISSAFKNVYLASYYCTNKAVDSKPQPDIGSKPQPDIGSKPQPDMNIHRKMFPPTNFEKKMLVWSGRYKSIEDIPPTVPMESIEKARGKARIRLANITIVATLIGCLIMVQSGKRAAERGESVAKMNEDWHRRINSESK